MEKENQELEEELTEEKKKFLDDVLADYKREMAELAENRRKNSERRSQMTEEELVQSLVDDYKEVLDSAKNEGVTVAINPKPSDKK